MLTQPRSSGLPIALPDGTRRLAVYTPPGYDPRRAVPYPTLYLSYGDDIAPDAGAQAVVAGILDNLIAARRTQPIVAVFPDACRPNNGSAAAYARELVEGVIPCVESGYNVSAQVAGRAFAGLTAAGALACELLFNQAATFGYVSIQQPVEWPVPPSDSPLWRNPALKALLGLHIGGAFDNRNSRSLGDQFAGLAANGIPYVEDSFGGREESVWRVLLRDFLTITAFKHTVTSLSAVVPCESPNQRAANCLISTVRAGTVQIAPLTGKIQFYVNGRIAGSAMPLLPDGTATLVLPQLPACVRTITAMYSGDNYYGSSVSAELSVGQ